MTCGFAPCPRLCERPARPDGRVFSGTQPTPPRLADPYDRRRKQQPMLGRRVGAKLRPLPPYVDFAPLGAQMLWERGDIDP